MAKPVLLRTKSALARSIVSPRCIATVDSCTRLVPLVITITGRSLLAARNTNDFAIWPTVQPIAAAASAAERVDASNSRTLKKARASPVLAAQCDVWLVSCG